MKAIERNENRFTWNLFGLKLFDFKPLISRTVDFWWNFTPFSFAEKYSKTGYYRYQLGDVVKLKCRRAFGYGYMPELVIIGHYEMDSGEDGYITLKQDYRRIDNNGEEASWWEWMKSGKLPENYQWSEECELVKHFKANVEMHFKKVRRMDVVERMELMEKFNPEL